MNRLKTLSHHEPSCQRLVALHGPLVEHSAPPRRRAPVGCRGVTRHKLLDYYRRADRKAAAAGGSTALERLQDVPDSAAWFPRGRRRDERPVLVIEAVGNMLPGVIGTGPTLSRTSATVAFDADASTCWA